MCYSTPSTIVSISPHVNTMTIAVEVSLNWLATNFSLLAMRHLRPGTVHMMSSLSTSLRIPNLSCFSLGHAATLITSSRTVRVANTPVRVSLKQHKRTSSSSEVFVVVRCRCSFGVRWSLVVSPNSARQQRMVTKTATNKHTNTICR